MRIACLQFAPQIGDVDDNMNRADILLSRANPQNLDLIVLPEMAFSGYSFSSLEHVTPYLESSASGPTFLWARNTALKYGSVVAVGYPEKVETEKWPALAEYYNSSIIVNREGETIGHYRKSFLYPQDENWASEGVDGFFGAMMYDLGNVAMGIGMDINPYKFESLWNVWEFTNHVLYRQANLVIISMAWITCQDCKSYSRKPTSPDLSTLSYWVARFEPLIRAEDRGEVIVVIANRCGTENNSNDSDLGNHAMFTGTSCVLGIEDGEVKVYGILGRGQRELLVVDTENAPQFKLVAEQDAPIYEDKAQSREAPSLNKNLHPSVRIRGPETPYPTEDRSPMGLEAAFGEIKAVSPVEPFASRAFFSSSPSKRRASVTSSDRTVTPIASTISSPASYLGQPISPDSVRSSRSPGSYLGQPFSPDSRDGRSPSEPSPISQEQLEKRLHIASVLNRYREPRSAAVPDSAFPLNSSWDGSPVPSIISQFINIIPPSPAVANSDNINGRKRMHFSNNVTFPDSTLPAPLPLRHGSSLNLKAAPSEERGRKMAQPSPPIASKASQAPTLKAPQLPPSRNRSQPRSVQRCPTIAPQGLTTLEIARTGFVVPVGAVQVRATKGHVDIASCPTGSESMPRARSVSPPPTPATALWAGDDKILWRESRFW